MAFVPGFEHDIFISYAHVNNPGGEEGAGGWVTQFHRVLEEQLLQHTGKSLKIWRDRRLDRNNDFDKTIKTAVESAALFLSINSTAYKNSAYCQDEARWFHERAQQDGFGVSLDDRRRIFHTLINQQPFSDWPAPFQGMTAYKFFEQVPDDDIGLTLELDSPLFKIEFKALVRQLTRTLLIFKDLAAKRGKPPVAAINPPRLAQPGNGFKVFLAATSDAQLRMRKRLATELEAKGISLAASLPPPHENAAHDERAVAELQQTSLSLHLLDATPGQEIVGAENCFYPQRQLELAQQHAPSQLIWVPRKLNVAEIEDEEQRAFLQQLELAPRQANGYKYLLYDSVDEIVREVLAKQQELAQALAAANASTAALLDAHVRDLSQAIELFDLRLGERNVPFKTNWGNDDPRKNLADLAKGLKESSHLILVFGQVPRDWVINRLREAVKICLEDEFRVKPCGIYFAPPHHLGEGKFDFGALPVLQFDHATLDQVLPRWLAQ
jgi:hypothetical protein